MSTAEENVLNGLDMGNQTSKSEKGPTPPPKELPEWRSSMLSTSAQGPQAPPIVTNSPSPAPGALRLKKKVPWKGRNILVLLPWDDKRGQAGEAPTPMTAKHVEDRMEMWSSQGYDTNGFNLDHEDNVDVDGDRGQSRSIWPPRDDVEQERSERSFQVSIPNRREWDAYVNELAEAKLRALGVTLGDEEPPAPAAPLAQMSRQASLQYPPLPFSPPIPTPSAGSSHLSQHPNLFSPTILPNAGMSTSQSSNPGSIASPASLHASLQGKFNPRQSVSFSTGEHPFGSPFQYPQQPSPGLWSPQQLMYGQGAAAAAAARGGSPAVQNHLGGIVSPSPPFLPEGYFQQSGDVLSQLQQRQQLLQNQLHQQQQMQMGARASPRLQEVSEIDEDGLESSKSPSKTPEARQFRHNPSASLQKEIDDAEYHLEEQFQRQMEHEDYSPHSDKGTDENRFDQNPAGTPKQNGNSKGGLAASRFAEDTEDGPVLHHPQPHSRGHSLSQRPFQEVEDTSSAAESKPDLGKNAEAPKDVSEVETGPSNFGTPMPDLSSNGHGRTLSTMSNPWLDSETASMDNKNGHHRGHSSKSSFSKLNVGAKEFKFDPTNAFKPSNFVFNGTSSITAQNAFAPPMSTTSSHFSNQSLSSSKSKSKINAAAPAFTPGQSEFSFSASGPAFKPDNQSFTPNFSESVGSVNNSGNEGPRTSIFGNIDLSALGITRPSKKSKAIPIIRPDSRVSKKADDEPQEDNDGRITQDDGRFKRARNGKDDPNSVPLFAPAAPLSETAREQSPPKDSIFTPVTLANKENSAPLNGEDAPEIPPKSHSRDISQASGQSFTSKRYESGLPGYGFFKASEDSKAPEVRPVQETPGKTADQDDSHEEKLIDVELEVKPGPPKKQHKKNSLSATAKPFEFRPGTYDFTFGRSTEPTLTPAAFEVPVKRTGGLAASRFASSPTPPPPEASPMIDLQPDERPAFQASLPGPESQSKSQQSNVIDHEPTFEEIDAVMRQLNEAEMDATPPKDTKAEALPGWHQASPTRQMQFPGLESSPSRLLPQNIMRSDAPSPSPGRFRALPGDSRIFSRVHDEDPFVNESPAVKHVGSPIHHVTAGSSLPASDWDDVISEGEEAKLQPRARFFDAHINDLVGGILEQRLDPLERTLDVIQQSLEVMASRGPSNRRERRSVSGALSDADDEDDDEDVPKRSLSPRRDHKMEKIRAIVTEALAAQQPRLQTAPSGSSSETQTLLQKLEEMQQHFAESRPRSVEAPVLSEDIRSIIEDSIKTHLPAGSDDQGRDAEAQSKIIDLEERLRRAEAKTEDEVERRRAVEDRLAENQRLLRISTEEEMRLRETIDEREAKIREVIDASDAKIRSAEEARQKTSMKIALLEANSNNGQKSTTDLAHRLTVAETDLRESRQEVQALKMEAERALEAAKRHSEDAEQANEMNKDLRRTMDSLRTQMEESIRVREGMRGMLTGLQEDMALAARNIAEENGQRAKKEAELIARQEVLDAKLEAEARTRERLETENERLLLSEKEATRAAAEVKRLETLVEELKQESHVAQKDALRYQREFEEAKESGLGEVQRTRRYLEAELDSANNQVNVVRQELEAQISRLRSELDQAKLDHDTTTQKHEMLLESTENSKKSIVDELTTKYTNQTEDMQTQHERRLNNAVEDAQRSEQHLLERLSLSSAKAEHLQDRVSHLEEKLEIAKSAANAAVAAAKGARSVSNSSTQRVADTQPATLPSLAPTTTLAPATAPSVKASELPEKISPQALRESIMVLQEQLQDREQQIEKLETLVTKLDPDAATKISKRDDEIMWLRELLSVRKSDLTDIVSTLETDKYDPEQVKDAAIRLRANLQMEEQERERAMNGGSALNLPNIAASLRDAASPRVAQAVGPLAAAWGNWRKGRADSSISEVMSSGRPTRPARNSSPSGSFLGGLLTPPASTARAPTGGQPTAFGSTGQRFTSAQLANRPRNMTPRAREKQPIRGSPAKAPPATPPMMRKSSYDNDAQAEDFSDAGFYDDDDESAVDDSIQGNNR